MSIEHVHETWAYTGKADHRAHIAIRRRPDAPLSAEVTLQIRRPSILHKGREVTVKSVAGVFNIDELETLIKSLKEEKAP